MLRIGVLGCLGKMGRLIAAEITQTPGCTFSGGSKKSQTAKDKEFEVLLKSTGDPAIITSNPEEVFKSSQVVIDFTTAGSVVHHLHLSHQYDIPLVIGTTGLTDHENLKIDSTAKVVAILQDFNTSLGHTLMIDLVERAARILDVSYDVEIFEMHHSRKKDAPSGSSLNLGKAIAKARQIPFPPQLDTNRNKLRQPGEIGFSVARGGNVTGDHSVMFAGAQEMLTLSHRAFSPVLFAQGAVKAAQWLVTQKPGRYQMRDVLGGF